MKSLPTPRQSLKLTTLKQATLIQDKTFRRGNKLDGIIPQSPVELNVTLTKTQWVDQKLFMQNVSFLFRLLRIVPD